MIIGMLCGGILVVIVGAVRTSFIWQMIATHDPSWWAMPHWIASEVEMDVAIVGLQTLLLNLRSDLMIDVCLRTSCNASLYQSFSWRYVSSKKG
jgi:hypothetical protein